VDTTDQEMIVKAKPGLGCVHTGAQEQIGFWQPGCWGFKRKAMCTFGSITISECWGQHVEARKRYDTLSTRGQLVIRAMRGWM
jgi:hypothetical protein